MNPVCTYAHVDLHIYISVYIDGCPVEDTVCGSTGSIEWPESEIGAVSRQPCPCGLNSSVFADLDLIASRECAGDFETGARWIIPECSSCNLTGTTGILCGLTDVSI